MTSMPKSRRQLTTAALASAAVAASLLCLLRQPLRSLNLSERRFATSTAWGVDYDDHNGSGSWLEKIEEEDRFRRFLLGPLGDEGYVAEDDYDSAFALASAVTADDDAAAVRSEPLRPYTIKDALAESKVWDCTFGILVYDPPRDKFVVLYSKDHQWRAGNKKLFKTMGNLAFMMRKLFPDRFTRTSPELVLAVGSGDYPHVRMSEFPRAADDGVAPVLMFGSAFRDRNMYPNMLAMPMPAQSHLGCFLDWVQFEGEKTGRVCREFKPRKDGGSLVFGDELGLEWNGLIPQVIWRGSDFTYLPSLQPRRQKLRRPDSRNFVGSVDDEDHGNMRADAIHKLTDQYDGLIPRWKGVALTADAELHAEGTNDLPWINIRISSHNYKGKSPTVGSPRYSAWESVDVGVGKEIWFEDLAKYKYHIDLAGGGGTTWSGTVEKLAMPGLLFHHVTPTKDYIHDRMKPWKHYVPVGPDLKDLKSKFDWAESHPEKAKAVADAGTELIRHLGTPEGFGEMFRQDFAEPLRRVIEAYQPVTLWHDNSPEGAGVSTSASWEDVLAFMGDDNRMLQVMECSGLSSKSCMMVGGDVVKRFQNNGRYAD